tara:strand:+ start:3007 stop:4776 length:1770 start_codon:yes stop_codon:yes gene_type:complete
MPRDSSGNYTLVAGNPVLSGEVIASSWANNTLDDISTALTNSLDRNGQGGMLAAFRFADGTKEEPGASWSSEITSGFYRPASSTGDLRVSILSSDIMRWNSSGAQLYNAASSQWWAILTDKGGTAASVPVGVSEGQMLGWDNAAAVWILEPDLNINNLLFTVTTTTGISTTGLLSAKPDAGTNAFSAGSEAGASLQQTNSVAIGKSAGQSSQGKGILDGDPSGPAVAIGVNSGRFFQERYATAVGISAGETNQGEYAVAIGYAAGDSNQGNNGIIVNSSGTVVDDSSLGHIRLVSNRGELKFTSSGGWEMIDGGITYLNVPATGGLSVTGTTTSTAFVGDGSGLTNLPASASNTLQQVTTAGNTTTNDIAFADNAKATFGASNDLQIYHTGSASIVGDFGVGDLLLRGENLKLQNTAGENYLVATNNGATRLYYDNAEKLTTTATGIGVTGTITTDGLALGDIEKATFGAGDDLQIYHDGNHSWIKDVGTGNMYISSDGYGVNIVKGDNTATVASFIPDGPVNLYNAGALKLATTATGIDVTGTVTASDLTLSGDPVYRNVTANITSANVTFSTGTPTGGANGDIWYEY